MSIRSCRDCRDVHGLKPVVIAFVIVALQGLPKSWRAAGKVPLWLLVCRRCPLYVLLLVVMFGAVVLGCWGVAPRLLAPAEGNVGDVEESYYITAVRSVRTHPLLSLL